jgi:hypothetical protein
MQDTFEDAIETGSVRSLTKRQRPVKRLSERTNSDYDDESAAEDSLASRSPSPDAQ